MKKLKSLQTWFVDQDEKQLRERKEYDALGNETLHVIYDDMGWEESRVESYYNSKGDLLKEVSYGFDHELNDTTVYEFDEEGKVKTVTVEYADGSYTRKTYSRNDRVLHVVSEDDEGEFEGQETIVINEHNEVVSRISKESPEDPEKKTEIAYLEPGKVSEVKEYQENELVSETKYVYNDAGSLIKRYVLSGSGALIDVLTISYDDRGNVIEQKYGDHTLFSMEYNEQNQLFCEKKVNAMGIVEYLKKYEYNAEGLIVAEAHLGSRLVYEYDWHD